MLTPREQGDIGELSAMYWLVSRGAKIWLPLGHSPHCDLVAELEGRLLRVQVKTSRCLRHRRWEIVLSTRGGNQSWSGMSKLLDPTRFDRLFVLVADGRQWFIPAEAVGGGSGIRLGGPKYAELEVEPRTPFAEPTRPDGAPTLGTP